MYKKVFKVYKLFYTNSTFLRRRLYMNAKEATKQIRLKQWEKIIQDRCNSGLKVDDYCEQHGISRHTYYYWLRMVRENTIKNKPEIVEITPATQLSVQEEFPVVQATDSSNAKIVIKKGDICISVNSEISPQLLSAAISSLTNA